MNLVLTDGSRMVATRYISEGVESNSLYYSRADRFYCDEGICHIDEGDKAFIVVSEPLDASKQWQRVENNQMLLVDERKNVTLKAI